MGKQERMQYEVLGILRGVGGGCTGQYNSKICYTLKEECRKVLNFTVKWDE